MSANKVILTTDNVLSTIGSYRIISYSAAFQGVDSITGVVDEVDGVPAGAILQRSFRWSTDGQSWSLWLDFDEVDQSAMTGLVIDPNKSFYAEFKYMVSDDPTLSPELDPGTQISPVVVINSFDLILAFEAVDVFQNFKPLTLCSDELGVIPVLLQNNFTFSPYNVNKGINLYKDLSKMTNLTFGHDVNYFRVTPQLRSADVVFHEWTLKMSMDPKCLKILVPNNEFPDSKPQYNEFGIDFTVPFEVHVDRGYWESIFGKNTMPQERDYLYFPLLNRMYEVQSTYSYRDFMQQIMYYKVMLVKYQDRVDVLKSDAIQALIDEATISTEELFGEDMKKEIERHTKPQQYVTITHENDPTRERVNRDLPIVRYNLYNNWTLVSENYYNLADMTAGTDAVFYRAQAQMGTSDSRSFTCWFSPIVGGGSLRHLLSGRNTTGIGMDVDLVFSTSANQSQVNLTMNSTTTTFTLTGVTLEKDQWYAMVVNVSNQFSQASVDIWVMQDNKSELKRIFHKALPITAVAFDAGESWRIVSSPLLLTNIRIFDRMLEDERQNLVLGQLVVQDSDKAIVIDNAKSILRLARVTNPK